MDVLNQLGIAIVRESHPLDFLLSGRVEDPTGELFMIIQESSQPLVAIDEHHQELSRLRINTLLSISSDCAFPRICQSGGQHV